MSNQMISGILFAPFTEKQVKAIEAWQKNERVHPLTCGGDGCRAVLYVTPDGLECYRCDYKQDWVPMSCAEEWKP